MIAGGIASSRWALLVIPLVLAFCGVSIHMLMQLRENAYAYAAQNADNLLAAVSQDISRNIEIYDLSLRAVQEGVSNAAIRSLPPAMRQLVLFDRAATARYLGRILVQDEHGNLTYDSTSEHPAPLNFADREYFTTHRDHPDVGLAISAPFRRRMDGGNDWAIALSRRINHPDGSFAGVVVGTLKLDYFRDLFARFTFGPKSAVTLLLGDGKIVARTPWHEFLVGHSIAGSPTFARLSGAPRGVFNGKSAVDGIRRVYSFTRLGDLPLILDVALAEDEIYATWHIQSLVIGGIVLTLCLAGILLGGLLSRELRRRVRAERTIRVSEAQYRLLAGNATDVIIRMDETLRRTYVSPASLAVLGYPSEALVGCRIGDIVHPDDWPSLMALVSASQRARKPLDASYRLRHSAGHYVWVEGRYSFVPEDGGFTVVLRDITKRKEAEQELAAATAELARLATSDGLTGLANRRCFDERLEQEWKRAARDEMPLSLLLLDVDHFKRFNDQYGHQAGDDCLRQVAATMGGTIHRPGDLAARYGGEELVVLLPATDTFGAGLLAERLRSSIEDLAIRHEGNPEGNGIVTVSVGTATIMPFGQSSGNGASLVAQADVALYAAKSTGRNRVVPVGQAGISLSPPALPGEALRLKTLVTYQEAGATKASGELDEITRLTASLFGTPDAFITLIGKDTHLFLSAAGPLPPSMPRDDSPCAHTIASEGVLVVNDVRMDSRFRNNPLVTCENGMRFYAGAPLISVLNDQPLGALCIIDRKPRLAFTLREVNLLTRLAGVVVGIMERRRLDEAPSSRQAPVAAPPIPA